MISAPPQVEFSDLDFALVESAFVDLGITAKPLSENELDTYPRRHLNAGWRFSVEFHDGITRKLDLLIPVGGGRRLPLIALVDRPDFLTWPHIERDGLICISSEHAAYERGNLQALVKNRIIEAVGLVDHCVKGELDADFLDEAYSYWGHGKTEKSKPVYLLDQGFEKSQIVKCWHAEDQFICAHTKQALTKWLDHRLGSVRPERKFHDAAFIWLDKPLHPTEFPTCAHDVLNLIEHNVDSDLLTQFYRIAANDKGAVLVIIAAPTKTGKFLGAIQLPRISLTGYGRKRRNQVPGFRPGKEPEHALKQFYFGPRPVEIATVERIDPKWIHGRDHNTQLPEIQKCSVTIVGCGSVGGYIAEILAQAGVADLILIDPQTLAAANVSRHPLGMQYLGKAKASSLASDLRKRFPHINEVQAFNCKWEELNEKEMDVVANSDLVISAIGDTGSELTLCAYMRSTKNPPHMLFTWVGAYALSAYALAIGPDGPCLGCHLDSMGQTKLRAIEFDKETTLQSEPACGNYFQPYGITELLSGVSAISDFCLRILLGEKAPPLLRVRVQSAELLSAAGGTWTPAWQDTTGRSDGDFTWEQKVVIDNNCPEKHD